MRKTKIVCTLGPSTDNEEVLRAMIESGMDVARFNFSHGSHEEHKRRYETLDRLRRELGKPVATLLDTKGPEIRLRQFKEGKVQLTAGQEFTLTTRDVEGDGTICAVTYKNLPQDVKADGTILLDDGLIGMTILEVNETDILCRVNNSGLIKNNKGVNVPGVSLSLPYLSARDKDDILFGVEMGFDFLAASFTRTAADIQDIRRLLDSKQSRMRIIAKIENQEGVDNIDAILSAADAIMIARGDMGVEIDFTEIPVIQKDIIYHSFSSGKPVITATQMLESMMEHPRPTRAEITDVANAIYDGTSAIMLSGETAAGKYPVEAVRTMAAIAQRTEQSPQRSSPEHCRRHRPRCLHHRLRPESRHGDHREQERRDRPAAEPLPAGTAHHCLRNGRAGAASPGAVLGCNSPADALRPQHRRTDQLFGAGCPGGRSGAGRRPGRADGRRAGGHQRHHQHDQGTPGGRLPADRRGCGQAGVQGPPVRLPQSGRSTGQVPCR